MSGYFSRFYDSGADIYRVTPISAFEGTYNVEAVKSVSCDVQPCTGGIDEGARGFLKTAEMRMYYAADDDIADGDYAVYDGVSYIITHIEKRRLGYCAYLERRELYVG